MFLGHVTVSTASIIDIDTGCYDFPSRHFASKEDTNSSSRQCFQRFSHAFKGHSVCRLGPPRKLQYWLYTMIITSGISVILLIDNNGWGILIPEINAETLNLMAEILVSNAGFVFTSLYIAAWLWQRTDFANITFRRHALLKTTSALY